VPEFQYPADVNVCDFQNNIYLEYGFKSLCQDTISRKKSLLTQEELDVEIKDFKKRINNRFTEVELSIEYNGDKSKITFVNEIINNNKTNIFAWFKHDEGFYYVEISGKDKDVSFLFDQILSTFKFLDKEQTEMRESDMTKCQADADCIVVKYSSCCGATKKAINKMYLEEYNSYKERQNFDEKACTVICADDSNITDAVCIDNQCKLKY